MYLAETIRVHEAEKPDRGYERLLWILIVFSNSRGGIATECPVLTPPDNGNVNYGQNVGDSAAYTCNAGYTLSGTNFRECQNDFTWTLSAPTCQIVDCSTPAEPPGGTADYTSTTYLSVLSYSCSTGHKLTAGATSATCGADSNWDNNPPTCTIDDCGSLTDPTDGTVSAPVTTFGAVATYTCITGYRITAGSGTRTCQAGASWSGTVPTCSIQDCGSLSQPVGGSVSVTSTVYGSSATFSCSTGYRLNGAATVTCQADGTWETLPTCDIKDCGSLTAPTDGAVSVTTTTYNSVATFTCDLGYDLSGETSATCLDTGVWSAIPPTCTIVDCGSLDAPTFGFVNHDPGTVYQFVAAYTCQTGYDLIGSNIRRCQADRTWSSTAPTCQLYDCGTPVAPTDGFVSSSVTTYESKAQYGCNAGYSLSGGTVETTCGEGTWSGTVPSCIDDDECTAGTDNCDVNAACANTVGSFTCTCNSGFTGDGVTCTDEDECTAGTDNCDINAACANTVGSFTCTCNSGFTGDGETCSDVDECTAGTDNCDVNAACANTVGSFTCTCNLGYSGDGVTCTDVDECTAGTDNCDVNAACANTVGSFTCTCNSGFTGDGVTCTDVDECTAGTDNCDVNAACANTVGSFTCTCNLGYSGDGVTCSDVDECTAGTDNCDVNAACANTVGSFTCTCNSGFTGNGVTCSDDDECTAGSDNCDVNAACANDAGSFTCTCNQGYSGDGVTCSDVDECTAGTDNCDVNAACANTVGSFTCTCNLGFTGNGVTCTDVDECTAGTANCDVNAACANTVGSFTCTCNSGYSGDGVTCSDVDECTAGTDNCDTNAACANTVGSFTCTCNSGFTGDGVTCTDVDECTAGTDNCDVNAACANTVGSFTCTCNSGFTGNGVTCSDVDECTAGTDNCDVNAACANTVGSFTCTCNLGFSGDGVTCTDVDECTAGTDDCDVNAACANTVGSFTCTCNSGFTGDGVTCSDVDECTAGTDNCDTNAACANNVGSFTCTCNQGYSGDGVTCEDCGSLSNPTDGTVSDTGTTYLETATYTCSTGYYISEGDETRTCQADGSWSGSEAVCTIQDCLSLGNPSGGTVSYTATTYQATATYTCSTGYQQTGGNTVRTCQADGSWSGAAIVCTIYTCPALSDPADGSVTATGNSYGDTGSFTCNTGYDLTGSGLLTCGNGNWDNAAPTCTIKDCGALSTSIDDGTATQTGTKYGDTTVYTCNEGYMISVGTVTRTVNCQADGTWDNSVPTCIVTDCGSLTSPDEGQVNTQPGTLYQQLASYTCNIGYDLVGVNVRECQADGLWDSSAPTCRIIDCLSLTNPSNGLVDTSSGTTFYQVATYTCDPGYEKTAGSTSRTCQLDGNWNGNEATCSRKDCGSLSTTISDGSVTQSGTLFEDTSIYTCNTGYYISTGVVQVTVTCAATEGWDGPVPSCIPVDCGDLSTPDGGQIDYPNTNYGTRASYTCNIGHDLIGINVRTCDENGNWDNSEPVCQIKDCNSLTDPAGGTVAADVTTYGETAEYTCDIGYRIVSGSSSRNCGADGLWDGVEPVCALYDCGSPSSGPFDTVSFTTTTYGSTAVYTCSTGYYNTEGDLTRTCGEGFWSGTAPTCTIRDCGNLDNPSGGSVTLTATTYSEIAEYTCGTGYYFSGGNTQRTCQADGTWSGTELQCTIYDCLVPQTPVFGTVDYTSTTYGAEATYSCDTGYYTTDTVTTTCGEGTWSVSVPTCTIHDCGALSPTVAAGSVVISGTTYDETAIYTCDTGYLTSVTSSNTHTLTCGQDGSWDDEVPTCSPVDCGGLDAPERGGVDTSAGTGYLDVAAYTCEHGYELKGKNVRTCQADGNWGDNAPVCSIYDCGSLLSPANGSVSFTLTTFSTTAVYSCNTGHYVSAGTPVRTCDHGGSWNGMQPTCTIYDCGPLSDPFSGSVSVTGQTYGETATYTCNIGYYRTDGDMVRTCGNNQWTGQEPTCTIRDCGELQDPPNGQVSYNDGTTYLQVANYTCDTGYRVSGGNALRTCEADGNWNGSELMCIIYDCGILLDIDNGGMTLTGTTYGETATYLCNRGYYIMSGDATRTCREGFWSGIEPICTIYDCGSAGLLTNGRVDAFRTQHMDTANYTCDTGYLINGTEVAVISRVCQDDGKWSGELPTCVYIDCGILRAPDNGMVDISRGTGLDDTAAYTCNTGYDLAGTNVRTCQPNGDWDRTEPTCAIKDCGELRNPRNGGVVVSGTTFGETANYLCLFGYYISSGSTTRTCRSSGFWDGTEPVCTNKIVTTPKPSTTPVPGDEREMVCGHRNEDLIFGIAVSSMMIESDFLEMKNLVRNAVYRSNIDSGSMRVGVFVFSQQVDNVIQLNDFNTSSELIDAINDMAYVSTNGPSQLHIGLSQLLVMFNGTNGDRPAIPNYAFILLDDNVNTTGIVTVASQVRNDDIHLDMFAIGFTDTSALANVVYKPNGHVIPLQTFDVLQLTVKFVLWKDSTCDCGALDSPPNGTLSLTGMFYLDVATFLCDEGFDIVGTMHLTCQYGGSWSGSPPRCVPKRLGTTQPPSTTPDPDTPVCGYVDVDIIVALAISSTVDQTDYSHMMTLVQAVIDHSDIDNGNTQLGFFMFDLSVRADTVIGLNGFKTREDLRQVLNNSLASTSTQSSQLSAALSQVMTMASLRRQNNPFLVYIVLDEDVILTDALQLADQLRNIGIVLSFAAIGFSSLDDLQSLAFAPSPVYVWEIPTFAAIELTASQFMFKDEECNCGSPGRPYRGSVTLTGTYFLDEASFSCDAGYDLVGSQHLVCQYGGIWNGSSPSCSLDGTIATSPAPTIPTIPPTIPPELDTTCGIHNLDVIYAIGVSNTMTEEEYSSLKYLVFTTIDRADIDFGLTRFGFFLFDTVVREDSVIHLKEYNSRADLILAIESIDFQTALSPAQLSVGLSLVNDMFSLLNGDRLAVSNMATVILDSSVDTRDSAVEADVLRNKDIVLGFLTVGLNNGTELEKLAYNPQAVFNVDSYGILEWAFAYIIFKDAECSCGELNDPEFGSVVTTGDHFLDVAAFLCDEGYELVGSQQLICQDKQSWSGSPPTCSPTGTTGSPRQTVNPATDCGLNNADVVFGMGLSKQTSETQFQNMLSVVKVFIRHSGIDDASTRFGFFIFDAEVQKNRVINLKTFDSSADLLAAIDIIQYTPVGSFTRLSAGLQQILQMFSSQTGSSLAFLDHAFIITDKNVMSYDTFSLANQILESGIVLHILTDTYNQDLSSLAYAADGLLIQLPAFDMSPFIVSDLFRNDSCDCGLLPSLTNGTVTYEETNTGQSTFYLDVVAFSCDEGFDLVGSQLLVCQYGGSWNGQPPTCLPRGITVSPATPVTTPSLPVLDKTCGFQNLDVIFGVVVSSSTSETDFEYIKNLLKTGIDRSAVDTGSTRIGYFVYGYGFMVHSVALDTYKTRSELHTSVDSFKFMPSNNRSFLLIGLEQALDMFSSVGNRADVHDLLYVIIDNDVDITEASFIAQQIRAARIHLDFVTVGFSDLSDFVTPGHMVDDFERYEDLQAAVSEGAFFKHSICNCGELTSPANGSVLFDDTYFLDVASFLCDQGYELTGSQQLACQYGGAWSGSPPTCSPKASLKSIDLLISLNMEPSPNVDFTNNLTYSVYKDQVRFALEKHYETVMKDDEVEIVINSISQGSLLVNYTVIISNTESSAQEFAQSTVDLAQGASLKILDENLTVTNMNIGEKNVNLVTLTAGTLSCTTFIEANGPCDVGYICQLEDDVPKCVPDPATDCGFPGSFVNGMVSTPDGTLYRTNATYTCNIGYTIEGLNTRVCESSRLWMPEAPTCVLADCGNVTVPVNGMLDLPGGTTYGQTAGFSCLPGYTLMGKSEVTCTEDSLWSGVPPACQIIDSFCGGLLDPQHGSVSTSDQSRINSRAVYTCNLGYRMSGPDIRICSKNMTWEPQQETVCIIQDCGVLRNPVNGNVDQSSGTTYGQTVIFSCSVGYQIFGAEQSICMADGNWSSVPPVCQITNCGGLPNPDYGLVSTTLTTFGQVATYTCNQGYTLSGTSSRICQPNGSWSSRQPDCLPRDCGPLFSPVNGYVNISMGTTYGNEATYNCNQGYSLEGTGTTQCDYTGIWNPPVAPMCVVIDCGILEGPGFGSLTLTQGSRYGSIATYRCDTGYETTEPSTRECLHTGKWSESQTVTTCAIVDCGQLPDIQDGSVTYIDSLTVFGSTATFSCNLGYFPNTATTTTTCLENRNWDMLAMPSCTIQDCGIPPEILNGGRTYIETVYGSFVNYTCDLGFDQIGVGMVMCTAEGSWDTLPVCSKIDCGNIKMPANGSVMYTAETHLGSQAVFDCDKGFYMTGSNISVCSEAGSWTTLPPFCILQNCGQLSLPLDGSRTLSDGTVFNSTAQFSCNTGYKLSGPEYRTCSDTGFWEPQQTTKCSIQDCGSLQNPLNGNVDQSSGTTYGQTVTFSCSVGYEIFGADQATCMADGNWSNVMPLCQITDCGGLSSPADGLVSTSETTFGQVASYTCNEGYSLSGTSTRICQPNSSWSSAPPICMVKDCGSLPNPAFGTVEYNDTLFESVAIYKCDIGYRLEGVAFRTCSADGRWSDTTPVCAVIDCGPLLSVQFGTFNRPQRTIYGTTVTFSCNTGYQLIGNATVTCLGTSQWSDLPSCVIIDCGDLSRPENGMLTLPGGTTYSQMAIFSCQTGYLPSGPTKLVCEANRSWSASPPLCQIADCGLLANLVNGGVTISGTKYGDYATYVCDAGHQISGSSSRLCQEDGNWSGSPPLCTVRDCGPLTAPLGGNLSIPSGTTYGKLAKFVCTEGFDLVGLTTLVCRADGTWSSQAPTCSLKEGLLSKDLTLRLNMTVPEGVSFSDTDTYSAYSEEVRSALLQHYGAEMKDNVVEIIIKSLQLGSLIVDYTVVMKDSNEAVNNFTQSTLSLAQGSTLEVFNQELGVNRMTVDNSPVDLVALSAEERACRLREDLSGPCQTGYVCTLVGNSPECRPDPSTDCGIPAGPTNGAVDYSRGTLYGNTVTYTCNAGFTLIGHNTRTCQGDEQWKPAAPTCSVTECSMLGDPINGKIVVGGTVHGQTAFFTCNPGYSLIGAAVVTCQLDGNWNYPPPTCMITGCGGLPSPMYGSLTISADGQTARYSCQTGYIISGGSFRTCLASNIWSGSEPTCNAIECVNLPDPQNGRVDLSGTSYGSTATYHCTEVGYKLSGTGSRVCGQDGQWSGSAPSCDIIECDILSPLSNGNMEMSGITYGQTVSFSCSQGFVLQGAQTLTCMAFGWSSTPPTCQSMGDCGSLDNPVYGFVTFTLGTAFLSKATYSCYMGYQQTGSEERVCQTDNTWSGTPATCTLVDCGLPSIPDGGRVDYTSGTTYGRVATYTCNTGYNLIGAATVTCQNDGTWSYTPLCKAKDCGSLPSPVNGQVDTVAGTTYGSTAIYTCNPGYYLQGVFARTCLATGNWDTLVPSCVVKDCGPLSTPTNGVVNIPSGTTYGQTATYACNSGYVLTGSSTRQCAEDGYWTGTRPLCIAVVCGSLSNPVNGRVTLSNGLVVGSVATYTCNPGYLRSPISDLGRTCPVNGTWTGAPSVCILIDCGNLSDPMFGEVVINQTTYGYRATFMCNQGYMLSGSTERKCASDGYWTGTQPVCTVADCGSLSNPDNGKVKMPEGTGFGDTAVYECNSGYAMKNYYKRTCQSNGTWSGSVPSCESSREFALAVGLGVGLTGFVILVLVITLIVVILYRRGRSKQFRNRTSRKYKVTGRIPVPPPMPVKINTGPSILVPYYNGPKLIDVNSDISDRHTTWRSRKADYGDPTNPLYYNANMPRDEYYSYYRN